MQYITEYAKTPWEHSVHNKLRKGNDFSVSRREFYNCLYFQVVFNFIKPEFERSERVA
jgi:hypothetical protein